MHEKLGPAIGYSGVSKLLFKAATWNFLMNILSYWDGKGLHYFWIKKYFLNDYFF